MREFLTLAAVVEANRAAAERVSEVLAGRPLDQWLAVLLDAPDAQTPEMLSHFARTAESMVDERPHGALEILAVAQALAPHVSPARFAYRESCLDITVLHAAALISLGRYFDALAALRAARSLLSQECDRELHRAALLVERARIYLQTRRHVRRAVFLLKTAASVFDDFGANSARDRALRFLREAGVSEFPRFSPGSDSRRGLRKRLLIRPDSTTPRIH